MVETPGQLGWSPDVIHCNDWQTALVPVYLLEEKYRVPELAGARTVFTIHNIEYQGRYGDQVLQDVEIGIALAVVKVAVELPALEVIFVVNKPESDTLTRGCWPTTGT